MAGGPDSGSGAPAHPAVSALGTVRAGLGELAAANLWSLPDAGLLELRTEQERLLAQLQAAVLATTREIDSRGAATATGASSTAAWLRGALHLHPGAAKAEVGLAADLERDLVATGAALAAGAITREQAAAIRHGLSRLPAVVTADTRRRAEAFLLEQASSFDPDGLFKLSRHLMLRLDPDQGETLEREEVAQHERQQFTLVRQPDGTGVPRGQLSAESTALIQTALDAVAGPRPARDGTPDPRTPAQRRADGLTDLVRMAMGAPDMPEHGGEPVTLLVTVPRAALGRRPDGPDRLADATDPAGAENASFDDGTPLSPESARRLGCDAWLVAAVVGTGPEVLDIGRMARTVPRGIRRALVARDGGCAFPGCGRPARWCHAHHIWHWEDGGPTALWNLVLLCGRHHRVIHHHGWTVWIDPDTGRPVFRPPRWIDPDQSPRPAWRPPTLPEHLPLLT